MGYPLQDVELAGRNFKVGPLTVGQRRRIAKVIAQVPPPPVVKVDVEGLVEAMVRPGPDQEEKVPIRELIAIRRDIKEAVAEQIREARARQEQWPPPVETAGDLIANNDQVQESFLWEVLSSHEPTLRREEIAQLMDEIAFHELIELVGVVLMPTTRAIAGLMRGTEGQEDPKFGSSAAGGAIAS
jgi:hypothetical protein